MFFGHAYATCVSHRLTAKPINKQTAYERHTENDKDSMIFKFSK